jgi:predicted nucleic acid-binding protein
MIGPFLAPSAVAPPGAFVLDVSIPLAWLITTRGDAYTVGVLGRIHRTAAFVPGCWTLHLAEALRRSERQRLKTAAEVDRFLAGLLHFPILVEDDTSARAWSDILALGRRLRTSVDNAAYIELALRLNLPLATTDAALTRSAGAAGVAIFTP